MRALLVFAAITCFAGVASAQSQNPLSYEAMSKSKAGQWAEYSMSIKGQPSNMKMRYSLVEKSDGKAAFEIDSQTPIGQVLAHLVYAADGPNGWKLTAGRFKAGGNTQDLPANELASGGIKKGDSFGKLVGTEDVKTAAGSFSCKHYKKALNGEAGAPAGTTVDVWMSDKVLPTGLVKVLDSRGAEVTLATTGTDAKPQMDMSAPAGAAPAAAAPPKSSAPAKK